MDRESPDVIEAEMEQTRQSLTDKVAALESEVVGTLQSATSTVQDTVQTVQETVESVKSAVEDTMSNVKGTVEDSVSAVSNHLRSAFDFSDHVRGNPWGMVGGAAAVGFVTGLLVFRRPHAAVPAHPAAAFTPRPVPAPVAAAAPAPAAPSKPSWVDDLLDMAGREARKLGEQALQQLSASLHQAVNNEVPKVVSGLAERLPGVVAGLASHGTAPERPADGPRAPGHPGFTHYT